VLAPRNSDTASGCSSNKKCPARGRSTTRTRSPTCSRSASPFPGGATSSSSPWIARRGHRRRSTTVRGARSDWSQDARSLDQPHAPRDGGSRAVPCRAPSYQHGRLRRAPAPDDRHGGPDSAFCASCDRSPLLIPAAPFSNRQARSRRKRYSCAAMPPAKPVSAPLEPISRWQGAMIAIGFRPLAAPTARDALGFPI
jgi:hypothetical protein